MKRLACLALASFAALAAASDDPWPGTTGATPASTQLTPSRLGSAAQGGDRDIFGRRTEPHIKELRAKHVPEELQAKLTELEPLIESCDEYEALWSQHLLMALATATENRSLRKDGKKLGKFAKQNWVAEIGALVEAFKDDLATRPGLAVIHYDPGKGFVQTIEKKKDPAWPELRCFAMDDLDQMLEYRRLIAGMTSKAGLSSDDALALDNVLDKEFGSGSGRSKYLVTEVRGWLNMMRDGGWSEYVEEWEGKEIEYEDSDGDTETYTIEFLDDLRDAAAYLRSELIYSKAPDFPRALRVGRDFELMGQVILRTVPADAGEDGWQIPAAWLEANQLDHEPILVVQLSPEKRLGKKTRFKRSQLGVVAGGTYTIAYEGAWPLR